MKKRPGAIIAAAVLSAVVLTACGGGSPAPGTTGPTPGSTPKESAPLSIAIGADALSLDANNYKATTDLVVDRLVYDGLVSFDLNMKIVPALAETWSQPDATTWQFNLRKGVKFTDGTDFNSAAVKFSLERAAKSPTGTGFVGAIDHVETPDANTAVLKLKAPFAPLLRHLATPVAGIVSPTAVQKDPDHFAEHPVGTGQFKLDSWTRNQEIKLVRNDGWWGGKVPLPAVSFKIYPDESARYLAFKGGQVDVIDSPPPQKVAEIKADPGLSVVTGPATRDLRLGFNVQDPVLKDPALRKAISEAIDTKSLVNFVAEGLARPVTEGFIPPEVQHTNPPIVPTFDAAKAQADLAKYKGTKIQLWTPQGRYLRDKEIAEAIQQMLNKDGLVVEVKVMDWGAYLKALGNHEGQMFIIGWGFTTGDPHIAMSQNFQSKSAFNYANLQDPQFDQWLTQAQVEQDQAKRDGLYVQMEKYLNDNAIMVPIYHKLNFYGISKRVHDFGVHPLELVDLSKTSVDPK